MGGATAIGSSGVSSSLLQENSINEATAMAANLCVCFRIFIVLVLIINVFDF